MVHKSRQSEAISISWGLKIDKIPVSRTNDYIQHQRQVKLIPSDTKLLYTNNYNPVFFSQVWRYMLAGSVEKLDTSPSQVLEYLTKYNSHCDVQLTADFLCMTTV